MLDILDSDPTATVSSSNGGANTTFDAVSIDTRSIQRGELFVALKGQNVDGAVFVNDALTRTHGAVITRDYAQQQNVQAGSTIITVDDTLRTLQSLARHLRVKTALNVIGITGTNGKTTTKEMTARVLEKRFMVLKTKGNLNNHIGLPLTLTSMDRHDVAVLEMGASRRGDIQQLCEIASPDIGIITNIGPGHLEGFGSIESVRAGKLELMDSAMGLIANADDRFLMEAVLDKNNQLSSTMRKRVITYALHSRADITARIINEVRPAAAMGKDDLTPTLRAEVRLPDGGVREMVLNVAGAFNLYNALAALCAGHLMGVDVDDALAALTEFKGIAMRLEIRKHRGATVLYDVYNANPASMMEAVKELVRLRTSRAIAVVGDMLELGPFSKEKHSELGRWMSQLPVDVLIAVGESMKITTQEFIHHRGEGCQAYHAKDCLSAREILNDIISVDDAILIKGSRSNKMETILE
ncbi:MAG: UDP-N-acetylmuramoyl-tripeptide--D-alanyl-D-alanine ligase [Nitrospirae bacterium]|nr:UDP-N-acetylmuramoyl-tripeptide--D-alanyl-D-alanine ligase [Nitrospirota bacterium]